MAQQSVCATGVTFRRYRAPQSTQTRPRCNAPDWPGRVPQLPCAPPITLGARGRGESSPVERPDRPPSVRRPESHPLGDFELSPGLPRRDRRWSPRREATGRVDLRLLAASPGQPFRSFNEPQENKSVSISVPAPSQAEAFRPSPHRVAEVSRP